LLDEADRAASKRRQLIALLAVAVVVFTVVVMYARLNTVSSARHLPAPTTAEP
jgi:flagellar basal body-associated protein FliL